MGKTTGKAAKTAKKKVAAAKKKKTDSIFGPLGGGGGGGGNSQQQRRGITNTRSKTKKEMETRKRLQQQGFTEAEMMKIMFLQDGVTRRGKNGRKIAKRNIVRQSKSDDGLSSTRNATEKKSNHKKAPPRRSESLSSYTKRSNGYSLKRKNPSSSSFRRSSSLPTYSLKQPQLPSTTGAYSLSLAHPEWMMAPFYNNVTNNPNKSGSDATTTMKSSSNRRRQVLPGDMDADTLQQLTAELYAFGTYVQLDEHQIARRRQLVQYLEITAQKLFAAKRQQQQRSHVRFGSTTTNDNDNVRLQVFGSFATLPVCVFSSDIDLALFGVVPTVPSTTKSRSSSSVNNNNNTKAAPTQASTDHDENDDSKLSAAAAVTNTSPSKRERLERWKQALADSTHTPVAAAAAAAAAAVAPLDTKPPPENDKHANDEGQDLLFVIDRTGVEEEEEGEEEGQPKVAAAAAATATTDEQEEPTAPNNIDNQVQEGNQNDNDSQSDEDSADKLESYSSATKSTRTASATTNRFDGDYRDDHESSNSDDDDDDFMERTSDDDDNNSNDDDEDDDLQVSFFSTAPAAAPTAYSRGPVAPAAGPTGYVRTQVIDALATLSNKLRKSSVTVCRQVTLIKKARVPICKVMTTPGVEMDIAVGGHNGTDTSQFAATQVELYESFAVVVLFLKLLLQQQGLDTPFTGGLGSYKLYVLVAYHIQQHVQAGGNDTPAEVLLSFLFRYGNVPGHHHVASCARTRLDQDVPLHYHYQHSSSKSDGSDDGTPQTMTAIADLGNVFQLQVLVQLFGAAFARLWNETTQKQVRGGGKKSKNNRNRSNGNNTSKVSFLRHLIDANRLQRERQKCVRQTMSNRVPSLGPSGGDGSQNNNSNSNRQPQQQQQPVVDLTLDSSPERAASKSLQRSTSNNSSSNNNASSSAAVAKQPPAMYDLTADELMAGYGVSSEKELDQQQQEEGLKKNPKRIRVS